MAATVSPQVEALYTQWLQGYSLRALGRIAGVSHSTVAAWFHAAYGTLSTNTTAMSLGRSLLTDYEDTKGAPREELVSLALSLVEDPEKTKHRSKHSLNMLGRFQVVHDPGLLDYLATEADPMDSLDDRPVYWEFLRLPYYLATLEATGEVLREAIRGPKRVSGETRRRLALTVAYARRAPEAIAA